MAEVVIIASKTCGHYPLLEKELQACGVGCAMRFVEDEPELVGRYALYQSPNLVARGRVVFRGRANHPLPSPPELRELLMAAGALSGPEGERV